MLRNLSIKSRLIFVVGFLSLMCISGAVVGLSSLYTANETLRITYKHRLVPIAGIDQVVRLIDRNQLAVAQALTDSPEGITREMDGVEKRVQEVNRLWDKLMADMRDEISKEE